MTYQIFCRLLLASLLGLGQSAQPAKAAKLVQTEKYDRELWGDPASSSSSEDGVVNVVWHGDADDILCPSPLSKKSRSAIEADIAASPVSIMRVCGRHFVFISIKSTLPESRLFHNFVNAHETFHAAAQLGRGMRTPLALALAESLAIDKVNFQAVHREVFSAWKESRCPCGLFDELNRMSNSQRIAVLWKIMIEWPAEYYSYLVVATRNGATVEDYVRLRSLIGDYDVYSSGVFFALLGKELGIDVRGKSNGLDWIDELRARCPGTHLDLPHEGHAVISMPSY